MALELDAAMQFLLIKRNLRKESLEQWLALASELERSFLARREERLYRRSAPYKAGGSARTGMSMRLRSDRTSDGRKTGQAFLILSLR